MAHVGILGGTFNPPHLGHLELARDALRELALAQMLLMPVAQPPHKAAGADPGAAHRLRMCELLIGRDQRVAACPLEIERGGPSYTVDTLRQIHASHPDDALTLVLGADVAATLPAWREPHGVLELAGVAVAQREGFPRERVLGALRRVCALAAERVRFLGTPMMAVSSSLVRERLARGEPVEKLVGPAVAAYIAEQGLYRPAVEAGAR